MFVIASESLEITNELCFSNESWRHTAQTTKYNNGGESGLWKFVKIARVGRKLTRYLP